MISGKKFIIKGIVQGVGFRPFVYKLAHENRLTGWVRNTSEGVEIEVNGLTGNLETFETTLQSSPPARAKIDFFRSEFCQPDSYTGFSILASHDDSHGFMPVSPDLFVCPDCLNELFSPLDRRFRYPFINCTNCGPRFSIIKDIPYDRPNTTMAAFPMCPVCAGEYEDPMNRRFHAQPTACPVCGPHLMLMQDGMNVAIKEDALQGARKAIKEGKIVAVKGLGGFHLACDAFNHQAVSTLRERKLRRAKPFALMAANLQILTAHCSISPEEAELLESAFNPIVLLEKLSTSSIAQAVAPGVRTLGFMLPYTPLHYLLLEQSDDFPPVLVMTSGNLSEEPVVYRDEQSSEKLTPLADLILTHNREIHERVDDSILFFVNEKPVLTRMSRGLAPTSTLLPAAPSLIFGAGADLKNSFSFSQGRYVFTSHFIGDLENYETTASYETSIQRYQHLFNIRPEFIACDLHPDYYSTRYAQRRAEEEGLPLIPVQHHHAHLAACLADNDIDWREYDPYIGLCFDGTGYGTDGAIWGGEFFLGNYSNYERICHLKYVPLAGGEMAIRKPARLSLSHLWCADMEWAPGLPCTDHLCFEERMVLRFQLEKNLNSVPTSSMGRLFDAVSAMLGVCQEVSYEGQAAIELEAISDFHESGAYEFLLSGDEIDPAPMWRQLMKDFSNNLPNPVIAARFQNGLVEITRRVCSDLRRRCGVASVALSGGVWQNRFLLEKTLAGLRSDGFSVLIHKSLPPNDGCISLGQVMVAAAQIKQSSFST
jgi:hydrogenase maturation protein HypF